MKIRIFVNYLSNSFENIKPQIYLFICIKLICLTFSGAAIINFVTSPYTVGEDDGSLMVCAQITGLPTGGLGCDVTVQTAFLDGNLASK